MKRDFRVKYAAGQLLNIDAEIEALENVIAVAKSQILDLQLRQRELARELKEGRGAKRA